MYFAGAPPKPGWPGYAEYTAQYGANAPQHPDIIRTNPYLEAMTTTALGQSGYMPMIGLGATAGKTLIPKLISIVRGAIPAAAGAAAGATMGKIIESPRQKKPQTVTAKIGGEMAKRYIGGVTDIGVPGPGIFSPRDLTPDYHGAAVKNWFAGQTLFQKNSDGSISVQRKDGTIKTYRPYRPTVFGKKVDASKFARLAKKYRKVYQELHHMFGKKGGGKCQGKR